MSPQHPTLSTGEAARALSVDRKTILNWIHAGRLDAETQRYGTRTFYRVTQASIDRMLRKLKKADQSKD